MSKARRSRQPADSWYVRLPDGQILRARSTEAVKHHVRTGRVPRACQVRRAPDEEWTALEWTQEFSDVAAPPPVLNADGSSTGDSYVPPPRRGSAPELPPLGIAGRLDPMRLQTVGVRGQAEDLLAALDSTLTRGKLVPAAVAGLVIALATPIAFPLLEHYGVKVWAWEPVAAIVRALAFAISGAIIARMAYVEVSRLRPAKSREITRYLGRDAVQLFLLTCFFPGLFLALISITHYWADWFYASNRANANLNGLTEILLIAGIAIEVLCWWLVAISALLVPIVVIEEGGIFSSLKLWLGLLWRHRSRVFVSEALIIAVGVLATIPFLLPLWLAVLARGSELKGSLLLVQHALTGLAAAPLLAFIYVANVFLFLHLRYETEEE